MKFVFLLSFLVFEFTTCFAQSKDFNVLDFREKNIVPPTYKYGYKAVCDSLSNLIKYYKIKPDSTYTYVATFALKLNKDGTLNRKIYSKEASDVFSKLLDTLPIWIKQIDNWHAAVIVKSKKPLNNYNLNFAIDVNSKIWITITDRKKLFDIYKISYPL